MNRQGQSRLPAMNHSLRGLSSAFRIWALLFLTLQASVVLASQGKPLRCPQPRSKPRVSCEHLAGRREAQKRAVLLAALPEGKLLISGVLKPEPNSYLPSALKHSQLSCLVNAPLWVLPDPGHCTEPGVSSQAPNLWSVVTESSERQSPQGAGYIQPCTSSLPSPCFDTGFQVEGGGYTQRSAAAFPSRVPHEKRGDFSQFGQCPPGRCLAKS